MEKRGDARDMEMPGWSPPWRVAGLALWVALIIVGFALLLIRFQARPAEARHQVTATVLLGLGIGASPTDIAANPADGLDWSTWPTPDANGYPYVSDSRDHSIFVLEDVLPYRFYLLLLAKED